MTGMNILTCLDAAASRGAVWPAFYYGYYFTAGAETD